MLSACSGVPAASRSCVRTCSASSSARHAASASPASRCRSPSSVRAAASSSRCRGRPGCSAPSRRWRSTASVWVAISVSSDGLACAAPPGSAVSTAPVSGETIRSGATVVEMDQKSGASRENARSSSAGPQSSSAVSSRSATRLRRSFRRRNSPLQAARSRGRAAEPSKTQASLPTAPGGGAVVRGTSTASISSSSGIASSGLACAAYGSGRTTVSGWPVSASTASAARASPSVSARGESHSTMRSEKPSPRDSRSARISGPSSSSRAVSSGGRGVVKGGPRHREAAPGPPARPGWRGRPGAGRTSARRCRSRGLRCCGGPSPQPHDVWRSR